MTSTDLMGRVTVAVQIENYNDLYEASRGIRPTEGVRRLEVPEALVDTGATNLSLPRSLIQTLGLTPFGQRSMRTTAGIVAAPVYGMVKLTVQGRDCHMDVIEVPDDCPVLIGQVPLELLDLVVDSKNRRLVGNPDHGGEHMFEQY